MIALQTRPRLETFATHPLADRFRTFVERADFPCVGAKSALARDTMTILIARDITSAWDDMTVHAALVETARRAADQPEAFQSLVVVFEGPSHLSERAFETSLWDRVQSLSDKDAWQGYPYASDVSHNADDPHFSLSFGEEAFFVVGLHPGASRPARRFETPVLVFNPHIQFRHLRETLRYEKMRERILERDVALAGSVNPMLARHGEVSEARQYSGRLTDSDWTCPFSAPPGASPHGS